MFPELFGLGPVTVYTYGVMLVLAFVAGGAYVRCALKREGLDPGLVYNLLFAAVLGGIVGARLAYVVQNLGQFAGSLWRVFFFPEGGLVFQGGAVGGTLAVWAVVRYERLEAPIIMDAAAPALAIGAAIGRVGCFGNGCCVGCATNAFYGLRFAGYAQARIPIQLVDMAYNLLLFGVLVYLATRPHRSGDLLWIWFAGYGAARFTVEFARAVPPGVPLGSPVALGLNPRVLIGLTSPQLIAIAMVVVGLAMLARGRLWSRRP